jgi:hypothetical protein
VSLARTFTYLPIVRSGLAQCPLSLYTVASQLSHLQFSCSDSARVTEVYCVLVRTHPAHLYSNSPQFLYTFYRHHPQLRPTQTHAQAPTHGDNPRDTGSPHGLEKRHTEHASVAQAEAKREAQTRLPLPCSVPPASKEPMPTTTGLLHALQSR